MNRQKELLMGRERRWEVVELKDQSAIGDGRQTVISHMPDADGTGSGYLLNSILSTL